MIKETYITTSWDDGHPLDLRVAELLTKYGLRGTFYVPMTAPNGTMTAAQTRELSSIFEIGAHTLHHVVLTEESEQQAWREIAGSKSWVEDKTGEPCLTFCAPEGKFSSCHVEMVRRAGFIGLRSVEFPSLDFPRWQSGVLLLPTSIQAYPHRPLAFARNAIKRMAVKNLWRFVTHGPSIEWPELARSFLHQALRSGGVFHLWGHSWELQETGQWNRLDETLRVMSEVLGQAAPLTNGQLCQLSLARMAPAGGPVRETEMTGTGQ